MLSPTPQSLIESPLGWKAISPRLLPGRRLFFEENQRLISLASDFTDRRDLGWVGHTPCPLAVDAEAGKIYRHTSETRLWTRDFSRIQPFDLASGRQHPPIDLPITRWICWLLERIPGHHSLLGYFAIDKSTPDRVVIDYQIGIIDLPSGIMRFAPVPFDAVFPMALSFSQGKILFRGWEGLTLTNLHGKRLTVLPHRDDSMTRGASIHPRKPLALLGGGGIYLWNWETGSARQIAPFGQHPVWAPDGEAIWFSRTSSDLWQLETAGAEPVQVLKVSRDRMEEMSPEKHFTISPDGQFLALQSTWKRVIGARRGPGISTSEKMNLETITEKCLSLLDLKSQEFWTQPTGGYNLAWS